MPTFTVEYYRIQSFPQPAVLMTVLQRRCFLLRAREARARAQKASQEGRLDDMVWHTETADHFTNLVLVKDRGTREAACDPILRAIFEHREVTEDDQRAFEQLDEFEDRLNLSLRLLAPRLVSGWVYERDAEVELEGGLAFECFFLIESAKFVPDGRNLIEAAESDLRAGARDKT